MVYKVSSRTARTVTQRNPVSKNERKRKKVSLTSSLPTSLWQALNGGNSMSVACDLQGMLAKRRLASVEQQKSDRAGLTCPTVDVRVDKVGLDR